MPLDYLHDRLAKLRDRDRLRGLVPRAAHGVFLIEPDGRRLINFGSNDYLGLAAERQISRLATGSMASALVCGWSDAHQRLADQIARLESTESAVLFPSGYAACSGTVATLAEAGDLILSDELNHASLIDGCRLSPATRQIFPHRDVDAVGAVLEQNRDDFNRVWIVTDSVFSMDGHLAPLKSLSDLAERYDATLIVDEAHGTGVLGQRGGGLCEAMELQRRVPIRIGTLSKAVGGQGGFVAASEVVIDYLVNRCRSLIFSTALAPAAVAVAAEALELISGSSDGPGSGRQRREHLHRLARRVRDRLALEAGPLESVVPIISLAMGEDRQAVAASRRLAEAGFYVPAIRPPTVAEGSARLRISLSAAHETAMVDDLVAALGSL